MANPTTYFGWVMPTSSSLVTNLPADFNTFGQGVDTSLQDLLGGTTGQVLSKTSATNMDFTWVTPTDQTPLTTKGDLFTFTTVDARLGIGANNTVLTADSAEATGMKWAAPAGGGKVLQVVSATTTTATTITVDTLTDTGITATITPTSASSKILVLISIQLSMSRANNRQIVNASVLRGATEILNYNTGDRNLFAVEATGITGIYTDNLSGINYLDAPATTSATTYKVQGSVFYTTNSGTAIFQVGSAPSTITLIEIGA
jgi:hypothetical protein